MSFVNYPTKLVDIFYLPVYNVDYENLPCLITENSEHSNPETDCWTTRPWQCYHLLQKITIFIDEKGSEDTTP